MRLFLGVDLDDAARATADAAARDLRRRFEEARIASRVSWVRPDNLHVTLRFLGEVEEEGLARLRQALSVPLAGPSFQAVLGGLGAFPPGGTPQVLWIGLAAGATGLRALHAEVESRLAPVGFPPESRTYHPHVTIARPKHAPRREARSIRTLLETTECARAPFRVGAVRLYQSRLSPKGSVYTPVLDATVRENAI